MAIHSFSYQVFNRFLKLTEHRIGTLGRGLKIEDSAKNKTDMAFVLTRVNIFHFRYILKKLIKMFLMLSYVKPFNFMLLKEQMQIPFYDIQTPLFTFSASFLITPLQTYLTISSIQRLAFPQTQNIHLLL